MTTYQIVEVKEDHVYCVVTKDDGSTFGQMVYGNASKTEAGIEQTVMDAIKRIGDEEKPREATILEAASTKAVKEIATVEEPVAK